MDKNAIKKYAVWARRELISRVSQRAALYGITENENGDESATNVNGTVLSDTERKQRGALIAQIRSKGYEQVMEEVAYTWFNRFSALRFMEVNGYLPSHVRVFTNDENEFKPQILAEAINMELNGLDMEKVYALKNANDNDELFKYLIIIQCNALSEILPGMFQRIADYTELLFPDNLLREGSAVEQMITLIPEKDWDVSFGGQVEIIGWLYQYYNDEKKNQVINIYKGTVKKEDIPAATQLFTTDWVVRYIVDNSVGRYWIERNPSSNLVNELEFFVMPKDGKIQHIQEQITPEQLTVFDPCMGSAHFGVYAFDVLMKIYREYGYTDREAAAAIVKKNLFGLDIDDRAAQLAYFAIMMKARQYDGRFLRRNIQPNFYVIEESNQIDSLTLDYFINGNIELKKDINSIVADMKNAREYGSTVQIHPVNFDALFTRFTEIETDIHIAKDTALRQLLPLVRAAKLLSEKYAVVATNPPYLNKYNPNLKKYIQDVYKDYSGDLFSVFIFRNFMFCKEGGYSGLMTPMVWMFLSSYEKLRGFIINNKRIATLVQMEYSAFEEATVPICSFVLQNSSENKEGYYFRLSDFKGGMLVQKEKVLEALRDKNCGYYYETKQSNFLAVPSTPIAYWLSSTMFNIFDSSKKLADVAKPRQGLATSDNNRFLKMWYEVVYDKIGFGIESIDDSRKYNFKWFPCAKGGSFRRWYGNNEYIVNWENDGYEIKEYAAQLYKNYTRTIKNIPFYFQEGLTWSTISSGLFSLRYAPNGFISETKGAMCFVPKEYLLFVLALYNTTVMQKFLSVVSPTLDYHEGSLGRTPIMLKKDDRVNSLVQDNIQICKYDWDSMETSWDFSEHPLVRWAKEIGDCNATSASMTRFYGEDKPQNISSPLEMCYLLWQGECQERFEQLKANEEELNRFFIDVYGLQDELTAGVEDKDVSVRKADLQRDIKSLISYAVGCMSGRYSLDVPGLAYAGGEWDESKYVSFTADKDGIIPISDDEYFDDDIVGLFVRFIETVYGKEALDQNLRFIANALGGKGSPHQVIRNYFMNDFYADHCKIYQKRPIYWLFDSGKKGGFKALIYMHRYAPDTIARIRTDYVHEQQSRYRTAVADLLNRLANAGTSERVKLNKKFKALQDQAEEIRIYEEKIHHLADQMISIDLDDGVKKNYAIFQDVLAKIK